MSLASREALNKLINRAEVAQFATHAEDWSTCSTTDLLTAAADELGKLAEREAYVNDTGTAADCQASHSTFCFVECHRSSFIGAGNLEIAARPKPAPS